MQLTDSEKRMYRVVGADGEEVGRIFSAPTSCTQNCNQGRMCDCVADFDDARPPMTRTGIALILATWVVVLLIALAAALI